jgi:hypothetical protein
MKDYYVIDAKRWFERVNGNTYHSVNVYKNGELLDRVPINYGYGSHYEQTALEILEKHGETKQESFWKFCEEKGEKNVMIFCNDVKRKKDL